MIERRDARWPNPKRPHVGRFPVWFVAVVIIAEACIMFGPDEARAQDAWSPMVVTAPGGTLNPQSTETQARVAPNGPIRVHGPNGAARQLPQGAWSPIVTGGIPQVQAPSPGAQVPPLAGGQQLGEPRPAPIQMQPLSPVRPVATPKVAASEAKAVPAPSQTPATPAPAAPAAAAGTSPGADSTFFKKPSPLDALPPDANAAQQYCFNTVDSASDARFAWQAQKIKDMEAELEKRVQKLQAKTEEYKAWLERRDAFSRKAHEKLVGFYSRMRPDAAAVQLATLDENVAAAVVTKLETKVASQIMGEMDPERAAKIAMIISGAAKIPAAGKRPPAPAAAAAVEPGGQAASPPGVSQAPPQPEQPRS
jgi:flagellar motility protein MotE (MotC chaperone)